MSEALKNPAPRAFVGNKLLLLRVRFIFAGILWCAILPRQKRLILYTKSVEKIPGNFLYALDITRRVLSALKIELKAKLENTCIQRRWAARREIG